MNAGPPTRRSVLALATGLAGGVAGCLGDRLPEPDEGEALVAELWVVDAATGEIVADTHDNHWHGSLPTVAVGGTREFEIEFIDTNRETIPVGDSEPFQLSATVAEASQNNSLSIGTDGDRLQLTGENTGETDLVFQLSEAETVIWEAPPIAIAVAE